MTRSLLAAVGVGAAVLSGCGPEQAASRLVAGQESGFCALQRKTARGTGLYVVECSASSSKKDCLLAACACGGRVVGSASTNGLLVETSAHALARIRTNACFVAVRELEPRQKVAEGFSSGEATVQTLTSADRTRIVTFLEQRGVEVLPDPEGGRYAIRAKLTPQLVSELAARGEVRRIQP